MNSRAVGWVASSDHVTVAAVTVRYLPHPFYRMYAEGESNALYALRNDGSACAHACLSHRTAKCIGRKSRVSRFLHDFFCLEQFNTLRREIIIFNIRAGGIYSYHCGLKGKFYPFYFSVIPLFLFWYLRELWREVFRV